MGAKEHTGSGTLYVNHILFSWDGVVMKSYFSSNQQEIYEKPMSLGFTCAVQLTQHVNNLFSVKPRDTEEVGICTWHVLANGMMNRALIVMLGTQSHGLFSNTKSFTELIE